jgi:hypothetical protein
MINKPKPMTEEEKAYFAKKATERNEYQRSLRTNMTPAQKKHLENYNKFMGVPEHEL